MITNQWASGKRAWKAVAARPVFGAHAWKTDEFTFLPVVNVEHLEKKLHGPLVAAPLRVVDAPGGIDACTTLSIQARPLKVAQYLCWRAGGACSSGDRAGSRAARRRRWRTGRRGPWPAASPGRRASSCRRSCAAPRPARHPRGPGALPGPGNCRAALPGPARIF